MRNVSMADQFSMQKLVQFNSSTAAENGHATSANAGDSRFSAERFEEACRRTMEAAKLNEEKQSSTAGRQIQQQLKLPNWADLDAMLKDSAEGAEQLLEVCKDQVREQGESANHMSLDFHKLRAAADSKPALFNIPDAGLGEAVKGKEENPGSAEQAQSSLLHLWWGLVQDQVGTLTREIDSLRQANSQMQVRQAEALMQRSDEQTARMNESMMQMAQMAQEHHNLKMALETEKEERLAASSKIWEVLRAEPERREEQQRCLLQLRDVLDAESAARQEAQQRQEDEVSQSLAAVRTDMDRISSRTNEAIASLSLGLEQEQRNRSHARSELTESIQQLRAGIDKETSRLSSVAALLQAHLDSMRGEIVREQEESAKRHRDLDEAVKQHIASEKSDITRQVKQEMDKASAGLAELFSNQDSQLQRNTAVDESLVKLFSHQESQLQKSRDLEQSLFTVRKEVKQLVIEMCAKEREQTLTLLARARQILESDEALRQRLQNLLSCEVVSKADYQAEIQNIWAVLKPHERVRVSSTSRRVPSVSRTSSGNLTGTRAPSPAVQPVSARFALRPTPIRNRSESPSVQGCSFAISPFSAGNSPPSSHRTLPGGSPIDVGNQSTSSLQSASQLSQRSVCVPPTLVSNASYQPQVVVVPPVMSCAPGVSASGASDSVVVAVPPLSSLRSD